MTVSRIEWSVNQIVDNIIDIVTKSGVTGADVLKNADHFRYGMTHWNSQIHTFPLLQVIPVSIVHGETDQTAPQNRAGGYGQKYQSRLICTLRCKITANDEDELFEYFDCFHRAIHNVTFSDFYDNKYNFIDTIGTQMDLYPNQSSANAIPNGISGEFTVDLSFFPMNKLNIHRQTILSGTINASMNDETFINVIRPLTSGSTHYS